MDWHDMVLETFGKLIDAFIDYPPLKWLQTSLYHSDEPRAMNHIIRLVERSKTLSTLDLEYIGLPKAHCERFANALRNNTALKQLDITTNMMDRPDNAVIFLAGVFDAGTKSTITTLRLNEFLSVNGLNRVLGAITSYKNLKRLNLTVDIGSAAALTDLLRADTALEELTVRASHNFHFQVTDAVVDASDAMLSSLFDALVSNKRLYKMVVFKYFFGYVEKSQRLIDTWNQTSETLEPSKR
jgi:hypothetical protein